ncbi:MAG: hypothetical protein NT084_04710 [Bacteroidetes bacterium]|nr:hypothetical protein [Bacteroidota bacterium]
MSFYLKPFFLFRRLVFFIPIIFGIIFPQFLFSQDTVFSDSSFYVIRSIVYSGNKQTKVFIMEHELTFKVGDTIPGTEFQKKSLRSQENLLNTSLFNFVTVQSSCLKDSSASKIIPVAVTINVKERWYTWPVPVFDVAEQNFNVWWRNGHNLDRASYGFYLTRYNFRGRKESIALICRLGYSQQFGGQYSIPYLNKKGNLGMTFTGTYTRNHEVSFTTQNNKLIYYKDPKFRIRGQTAGSILFSKRNGLYIKQTLDFRYTNLTVTDTITALAPDYFVAGKDYMEYFTISYHITRDYRDIKAYPLKGNFEELEITKHGLGILADEKLNLFVVAASVKGYAKLYQNTYVSAMVRGRWLPSSKVPYYHQRALGFSDFVRGYEYYVIDGQSYVVAKTAIRYAILNPHIFKIPFLPIEKFNTLHLAIYAGLYADAGYVDDNSSVASSRNFLGNDFLFGYGAGLDFITYYDVALRIEYSFNRRNENGLFIHMGAAF